MYKFWLCRHGIYRGAGAFGQYCIVMPEQDAVLAITSGVGDMQEVLDIAWDNLLPAMRDGKLPADETARGALEEKLGALSLKRPQGDASSSLAAALKGKRFDFAENERKFEGMSFVFS